MTDYKVPPVVPGWADTAHAWGRTQEIPAPPRAWASPGPPIWAAQYEAPRAKGARLPTWAIVSIGVGFVAMLCFGVATIATNLAPAGSSPVVASGTQSSGTVATTAQAPATKLPAGSAGAPVHKIGQTVRGGEFALTVHARKCGIASAGDKYLVRKAQGSYCRIDLTVKNVATSPSLFDAGSTVTATDAQGRKFSADGTAGIYGNKDAAGFLNQINPGNEVRAFVYFDVPKGGTLTGVTFRSGLGENVTVSLL
jgi:hypothetical protein